MLKVQDNVLYEHLVNVVYRPILRAAVLLLRTQRQFITTQASSESQPALFKLLMIDDFKLLRGPTCSVSDSNVIPISYQKY